MAEQTFKSPGFFEREIEVIAPPKRGLRTTPFGVIGPAERGPAFVPVTVNSLDEFKKRFGKIDQDMPSGHAVAEYFSSKGDGASLTFMRVLGTGKDVESATTFEETGIVPNAGFFVSGSLSDNLRHAGAVHFLVASHSLDDNESYTYAAFSDNQSISGSSQELGLQLVRGMLFLDKDTTVYLTASSVTTKPIDDSTRPAGDSSLVDSNNIVNLFFSSSVDGSSAAYPISFDPDSASYISNVLNTNPYLLSSKKHYLYADFPVDKSIASPAGKPAAILCGLTSSFSDLGLTSGDTADSIANAYGQFETRYRTPRSPTFISQPFGNKEYNLFHLEAKDDGVYATDNYKVSIRDLRASSDPNYKYGSFTVELRDLRDTDEKPIIIESFSNCNLDPKSSNYIARIIGDKKLELNLDVSSPDEKRLMIEGTFPNNSRLVRVVMAADVINEEIPEEALPFGFRGLPLLKTTSDGKDGRDNNKAFLTGSEGVGTDVANTIFGGVQPDVIGAGHINTLSFSVLPPVPYRFKVTKGDMSAGTPKAYLGQASAKESVDNKLYWGAVTTRVSDISKPNNSSGKGFNRLFESYAKFLCIDKFGTSFDIDSAEADNFNSNKFSLSRVAFSGSTVAGLSGSYEEIKNAAYIRDADVLSTKFDTSKYTININGDILDSSLFSPNDVRVTFASLLAEDKKKFNKYSEFAKFTATFFGGFDGINIMDEDSSYFNDRATSTDTTAGKAGSSGFISGLARTENAVMQGSELDNNIVNSYNNAIRLMTDPMMVNYNALAIPGIRDPFVVDEALLKVRDYGRAIYVMDIPSYAEDGTRLFGQAETDGVLVPDVDKTANKFDQRTIDNNFAAVYFPDVYAVDAGYEVPNSSRLVKVPSSVVAFGALAKNDTISAPWFAPAGFNRGGLERVQSTVVRLNSEDRDTLYEARINPIANFPNNQFVIFGQKTLQLAATSLDRVNVRRLVLEVKRQIEDLAQALLFEQNDQQTRNRFIEAASNRLALIRLGQGIEDFRVVMDDTNNSDEDVDNNRLNGRIIFIPTRAIEFIAMDFIVTNSGVQFPE